jgi:hypothetical protein
MQLFTDYLTRLMRYVEFMKRVVPMHDDLFDFFYEALPGYEEVGRRRACWSAGAPPRPRRVQLPLQGHDQLGPEDVRHPGVSVDGKLVTNDLVEINLGHPDPARQFVLRRLGRPGDVRHEGPAGQPGGPPSPVEPAHDPAAGRSATSAASTAG